MLSMMVLLMMELPLHAQNAKMVDLEGTFNFSAGTDSRAVEKSANFEDTFFLFAPSFLSVNQYSPRARFLAYYIPEFVMFREHHELNSWNHAARLGLTRKFSPRFSFDMGDSFLSTTDPSRQLANSFLLLPRGRYQENAFYVLGDYGLNPLTMLSVRFDNTVTRYGLAAEVRARFPDQMGNSWTGTLARHLKEGKKVTATYTLIHLTILNSPDVMANAGPGTPNLMHYFTVGYLNSTRKDLTFGVSAGVIRAGYLSYAISGQVRKKLGSLWLDAEYDRTLMFLAGQLSGGSNYPSLGGGLLASNLYEQVTGGVSGNRGHVGLNLRVTGARTGSASGGLTRRSLFGALRLDYRITGRVMLYAAGELYSQNLNTFQGASTGRQRFYIGLELSLHERHQASGVVSQTLPAPISMQTSGTKEE
jgi:hypothetical protein